MKTGLESLDTGASKITYSGNEGPQAPQQMAMADPMLVEQYQQYVFEMEEQGLQPMSFEEFVAQARAGMNKGGIANPRLVPHTGADLLVKKNPDGTRPKYQPPGGGATSLGSGRDYSPRSSRDNIGGPPGGGDQGMTYTAPPTTSGPPGGGDPGMTYTAPEPKDKKTIGSIIKEGIDDRTKAAFNTSLIIPGQTERIARYRKAYKEYLESMGITPPASLDDEDLSKFYVDGAFTFEPGDAMAPGPFEYMQPDDVMNYGDFLLERFNNPTVKYRGDLGAYKRDIGQGGEGQARELNRLYSGQIGVGGGGGGTTVPPVVPPVETENPFVPGSGLPFANYYVGANPNAAQLAYGQQMGVDPRMYGLTAYADGGRIGYAGGGITGLRQGYFLGKLVKKIGRGIKKVAKSPVGKLALIGGLAGAGGFGPFKGLKPFLFGSPKSMIAGPIQGLLGSGSSGTTGFLSKALDYLKTGKGAMTGIAALSALPLLFGESQEEEEGMKYADLSNIFDTVGSPNELRARALRGELPQNEFPFQPYYAADGGRVGLMGGGDLRAAALNQLYGINDDENKKLSKGGSAGLPPITQGVEGQASQSFSDDETPMPTQPDQMPRPNPMMMAGRMNPMMRGINPMMARGMMPRMMAQEGGLMDMGGMEKDYRNEGGFVPIGGQERADDVPARLSKNEFVFTADAVRAAGGGDIDKGAEVMENMMENLEKGGKVSEESQGLKGARDMFATAQRLEGVL